VMLQPGESERIGRRGYALCVGIGTYSHLVNRNLRYAVDDATVIAERLVDPQRGNFAVTVLTEPAQTTKAALEQAVEQLLGARDRRADDLALLYFSCHGDLNQIDHTFSLLPSDASLQDNGMFDQTTLVSIYDFARWFENATAHNIVVLLDVCHSGGAGATLQHFTLKLETGPNFFFIGAARLDQVTMQSSLLQHGLFTHCLLRAFEQPPTADGWLTISQIHTFVSDEFPWFAKDQPIQIQSWSVSVNPNLPLLRNPGYPELCPLPPLWNVPLSRNVFFTGQEELLFRLASILQGEQKTALTQPHALSGLGGIGKTQLALEYAYRHRQDYHAVLWGRADTHEALISTFLNIAHLLDLPQKDEQDQMVTVEAVKIWLGNRSQWLFILDNADDLALVKEFLPPAFQGHLLLTTRAQTMGKVVRSKLEVEVMRPEIGALLLLRRARMLATEASLEEAPDGERTRAKELAEELGGLPLALDQAGAYIEETQCGLAGYQRLYQTRRTELLRSRGGVVEDHPESVATTWSLSFEQVEQRDPAAADLLRLCAFLAPDAIPEELLSKGARELGDILAPVALDAYQLNQAITALRAYSLISRDAQAQALTVHRLVQVILRDSMPTETQQDWLDRCIRLLDQAFPSAEMPVTRQSFAGVIAGWMSVNERWDRCKQLVPHVLASAALSLPWENSSLPNAVSLFRKTAGYLAEHYLFDEAERLYQRVLAICEHQFGPEHPDTAISLNNLASLYRMQGRYSEAERLYQQVISICEHQLGSEDPLTATTLATLASFYWWHGRYSEAEPLYQRVLSIREQQFGPEHPDTATSLNNLATVYTDQGKYVEAERLYQRAIAIGEKTLGPEHPALATPLDNLALLYDDQGKYTEAEPLKQRVWAIKNLAICEQQAGPEHPDTAISLNNLAELYRAQGMYTEAERLYQRALSICERQFGPECPDTATTLHQLGYLYQEQDKYEQAEPLYQRALQIREQALGPEHPDTATTLHELARLYQNQGKYEQAESLCLQALHIFEQALGSEHPNTAVTLSLLARLYQGQRKYVEAEQLFLHALRIHEQVLGSEHPDTATILFRLATLYQDQGTYEKSEPLYQHALRVHEHVLGPQHPHTARTRKRYASLLRTMGRTEEAALLEAHGTLPS
jgi:tetratricopeptide (TPR) repeat protein